MAQLWGIFIKTPLSIAKIKTKSLSLVLRQTVDIITAAPFFPYFLKTTTALGI